MALHSHGSVLEDLSSGQRGMFTTAQAGRRGVSRVFLSQLAAAGRLERIAHGVYRDSGAPEDERDGLRAAWLAIRPESTAEERLAAWADGPVVCGATAAWLHGLGTLQPEPYEFSSPQRLQTRRPDVRFRRRQLDAAGVTAVAGLPTTTPTQTIADLVNWRTDISLIGEVVADAVAARMLDPDDAAARLAPLAARQGLPPGDGTGLLERLLSVAGVDPRTVAERTGRSPLGALVAAEYTAAVAQQLQELTTLPPGLAENLEALSAALVPVRDAQRAIAATLAPMSEMMREQFAASEVAERLARQSLVPMSEAMREQLEASEAMQEAAAAIAAPSLAAARQPAQREAQALQPLAEMSKEAWRTVIDLAPLLDSVEGIVARSEMLGAAAAGTSP